MCIIAFKPPKVAMPSDEIIKRMFERNPHGAGYAIQRKTANNRLEVKFKKGLMTLEDFNKAIKEEGDLTECGVAMHFRIATAGFKDGPTTHPFPLESAYNKLRQLEGTGPVLFHNGIMPGLGGGIDKNSSDTQDFVSAIGATLLRRPGKLSKNKTTIIEKLIGYSKLLVLYPCLNHPVTMMGHWEEDGGVFYSNDGFRAYSYKYHTATTTTRTTRIGAGVKDWDDDETPNENWGMLEDSEYARWKRKHPTQAKELEEQEESTPIMQDRWYEEEADGFITFDDEYDALAWCDTCKKVGSYIFAKNGQIWYLDTIYLVAYSSEYLGIAFKTGELGHVKNILSREGTLANSQYGVEAQFGADYPRDDDYEQELAEITGVPSRLDDF